MSGQIFRSDASDGQSNDSKINYGWTQKDIDLSGMLEARTARSRYGQGIMMESRIDGVKGVLSRVYPCLSVVGLLMSDIYS